MKKYFVTGGTYTCEQFKTVHKDTQEEHGPYDDYQQAYGKWQALSMQNIDNALTRFLIREEETADEFWVIGGVYQDTDFTQLINDEKVTEFGPYTQWQDAEKQWRSLSMKYMDNAMAKFEIKRR